MRGILADINVGKQQRAILAIWATDAWRDFWNELGLAVVNFPRWACPSTRLTQWSGGPARKRSSF